jgi:Flp pilus assembly protein TadB
MVLGIILMFCAIMIALYPPLLSIIVAALLFMIGSFICIMGYRYKKMAKKFDDPFLDFFMKM